MKQSAIAGDTRTEVTGAKAEGRGRARFTCLNTLLLLDASYPELSSWRSFQELPQRAQGSVHPSRATLEKHSKDEAWKGLWAGWMS